ncbi:MAG: hypothetical protein ACPGVB_14270, partial [Chitinophagales bacterium]
FQLQCFVGENEFYLHLHLQKNMSMNRMTSLSSILFLFFCVLFVNSCTYSGELQEVQLVSNDGKVKYAISFPNYMKKETEKTLGENASLQYASFYRNIYVLVIDQPVSTAKLSLEEYYHQELGKLEGVLKNPLRLDSSRVEMDANPAYHIQVVGKVGEGEVEKRILYRLVFFEAEQHLFQLVLWGWDERRDSYLGDFDKIVNSFKILK